MTDQPYLDIKIRKGSVWTTTITVFEIRFGLALLAAGRRRQRVERAFDSLRSRKGAPALWINARTYPPSASAGSA